MGEHVDRLGDTRNVYRIFLDTSFFQSCLLDRQDSGPRVTLYGCYRDML
jgi:hypothetical protein